jgi:hypothetical protein
LTNHLTDDGAERIVDSIVSGMNASHFGVIHRAVCAQFSKPELTPAQKGYSEWPLEYPHCGGLPRSVRSIEGNKFCLTWEKPEEEVYVKACKPQFAWLKNWTVTVTDFKWKDPGPRLSTYKARQMVVQENFRFGAAAGIEYFEIIGLDKEFIENYPKTPGYYTPDVTMGDLTTWEKSDEGWLSSAVYKHYGTGHEGLARFLIERDGDLCIHYNVASVEEVPARPCDHRKDF